MKFLQKVCILGDYFVINPKTGGCALQIKVATDQENIFHFELSVNKVLSLLNIAVIFFKFVSFLLYPREVKMLKSAMLGAFTVCIAVVSYASDVYMYHFFRETRFSGFSFLQSS